MLKKIITLGLLFVMGYSLQVSAQNIHEATVKFEKSDANAMVAEYGRPLSVMEEALKKQLEKEHIGKAEKSKGFILYKGAAWKKISLQTLDFYFKVEGNKTKATITVLVSKGYANFVNSGTDSGIMQNLAAFLNGLEGMAADVQYSIDLSGQQFMIEKAEKEYARSLGDSADLASDKRKLEARIAAQAADLQSKQQAVEAEKQKLEAMRDR